VSAEERFARLMEQFAGRPGVEAPSGSRQRFGSDALKVNGSIFAMVRSGGLIVKLPRHRVEALIADGTGSPFDAGKGRPMKEWLTVQTDDDETWLRLAGEALEFVRGGA
jgi:TfoX/Sxy family transcriptional regulator of competence genes